MKTQSEICEYLKKNKDDVLNDQLAQNTIRQTGKDFLIGDEVHHVNESSARYFKIFFNEIRTDQLFVQLTPMVCFRSGHLKIDRDGNLSLTDDKFNTYRSSKNFYFDQDKLKATEDWGIASEEKFSSRCVKGLFSFGMFAVVAGTAYYVATNTNTVDLKLTL